MSFNKRIASESAHVVEPDKGIISSIFSRLGKSEATELEILRTAREMGVKVVGLRKFCTETSPGRLSLTEKEW